MTPTDRVEQEARSQAIKVTSSLRVIRHKPFNVCHEVGILGVTKTHLSRSELDTINVAVHLQVTANNVLGNTCHRSNEMVNKYW